MSYKKSKYNIIIERPEGNFLWNTCSNAFIRLNEAGRKWLETFNGTQIDSEYFRILEKNGCLVMEELDETGKILIEEKTVMLNTGAEVMHFTIAPGLGCNYNCPYCFEKGHDLRGVMNDETRNRTVRFIINKMQANPNLRRLEIRWFGGEPLLYLDMIELMSRELMKYCRDRHVEYSAGIVTNGRYLTRECAKKLAQWKVGYVQLSMDGLGAYYEQQKGARPGDFHAVVKNIEDTWDLLDITVRINIADVLEEALKLTEYLLKEQNLDGKIRIYVAHIRDYEGRSAKEEQTAHARFLELEGRYISLFGSKGKYSPHSLSFLYPTRRCTTCKSVCGNNFCIGPKGELYRCEHHYGQKEYVVGNIWSGRFYSETEKKYLTYRHRSKCLDCKLFPVCLGGCMNDNKDGETSLACEEFLERQIDYLLRANVSKHGLL